MSHIYVSWFKLKYIAEIFRLQRYFVWNLIGLMTMIAIYYVIKISVIYNNTWYVLECYILTTASHPRPVVPPPVVEQPRPAAVIVPGHGAAVGAARRATANWKEVEGSAVQSGELLFCDEGACTQAQKVEKTALLKTAVYILSPLGEKKKYPCYFD